jgi:Flp pilus assembly protein CpaB
MLTREFIRQDEEGEWICPKSEEVLKKAGVLTIEEYIARRRQTIMKYAQTRNIYGKCKSFRKIASNVGTFSLRLHLRLVENRSYPYMPICILLMVNRQWNRLRIYYKVKFFGPTDDGIAN